MFSRLFLWCVFLISFAGLLSPGVVSATVYSDGESGAGDWIVSDNRPAGASVSVVTDSVLQSQVIQTNGQGRLNGYLLGGTSSSSGWNNTAEPIFEWKMATNEPFVVMVQIETAFGIRRLNYNQSNSDLGKNPGNNSIAFGLGSSIVDGAWRTHRRNLAEDVAAGEPGNSLISVNGVAVLGSLRLDDISLLSDTTEPPVTDLPPVARLTLNANSGEAPFTVIANAGASTDDNGIVDYAFTFGSDASIAGSAASRQSVLNTAGVFTVTVTVTDSIGQTDRASRRVTVSEPQDSIYSDAENGTDGWIVYDTTPAGATVTSVFDEAHQSRVIRTLGAGRANGYLLGGVNSSTGWNNRTEFNLSWDMSTDESFVVQVHIDTTRGIRRLYYNQSNSDSLKNPANNSIAFGLGSATVGAGWQTFERNLASDVSIGEPGNTLLGVNGIVVLGSLRLDNITLSAGGTPPPLDTAPTAAITASTTSGLAPLSVIFSASASTAAAPATLSSYSWDFGNNDTADSAGASTTYTQAGSYAATLTVTDSNGLTDTSTQNITVQNDDGPPPEVDTAANAAARLLAQATFGPTLSDIAEVQRLGIEGWVDDQFTRQGRPHLEYVQNHPGSGSLSGPRQHKWLIDAIDGADQLRQRVAFAYSEIFVTSDLSQNLDREQYAMTNYYDILLNNAFGNYRDLIEEITLSPIMGIYLSMLQNARGNPADNTRADENFAREIMQLFSIGLYQLNNNGTIRRDSNGQPLPAYTQADVEEYARVYTGWTYADADRFNNTPAGPNTNKFLPMQQFGDFHDSGQKTLLLGVTSPAGVSAEQDLDIALDSLFNHPNVGPFIGKQLIQRLVTSNPTPAYVSRVANAFNNNGDGTRGDMRAVIRAILLDPEARSGHNSVPNYGKLREPLIRWTHIWRSFNVQRGSESDNNKYTHSSPYIYAGNSFLGQSVLSALSVFNFFHPDYAPLGEMRDAGLVAPESEIYSDANILTTTARLTGFAQIYYHGGNDNTLRNSYIDLTEETELAANPAALLDRLDLLLTSGQMSSDMRSILLNHMSGLSADEAGRSQRVRDAITLIMASPEYLVQK